MELIQPAEISGKIMTLIDQSIEKITIISPYNKISNWKKLVQRLEKAKQRGVKIKWYIRKNVENNTEQIRSIGIEPVEIENLHCKIYLNENHAVVTSMNLHEYSDSSSIDIGYLITESERYQELLHFINIHIDNQFLREDNNKEENNDLQDNITQLNYSQYINKILKDNGFEDSNIKNFRNKYGSVYSIVDFYGKFELILEPKGSYYRIDLRINYPYKLKNDIYIFLQKNEKKLSDALGFECNFGSQMKRITIDLLVFDNYKYATWSINEFEKLELILKKILDTYRIFLTEALKNTW